MRRIAVLLLIALSFMPVSSHAEMKLIKDIKKGLQERMSSNAVFTGRHFRCIIPKSWDLKRDQDSLFLSGPRGGAILPPKMSVDYYGTGNASFRSPEDYLDTNREGGIPLKGEKTGPVEKMRVAGLPAKGFFRDTFEYVPPNSLDPVKVPVREEYIVLPQREGFFVLLFSAPAVTYRLNYSKFQRLVDSFHPLP